MSSDYLNQIGNASHSSGNTRPSFTHLEQYSDQLESLFAEYGSVLAPCIVEYEVECCEFPVEILNEIRAIYAHLYRASVTDQSEETKKNIEKALSHSKRAALDGYKYLCVAYDDRFHEFFKKFRYVNWEKSGLQSDIADIDFKRIAAVELLRTAKLTESTEHAESDSKDYESDYRNLYKSAYEAYKELANMLEKLEHKMLETPIVTNNQVLSSVLFALCGVVLGFLLSALL